ITDSSRRWLVQHRKPQFAFLIYDAGNIPVSGGLQVLNVAGAVDSLQQGRLNEELDAKLAQQLSIEGVPKIQEISLGNLQHNSMFSNVLHGWTASYTRSIAIKIT